VTNCVACPAPFAQAVWLVFAIGAAGVIHVLWLKSPFSRHFRQPLDGGLTIRGRRLFGENKTLRGLMAMPPAAACTFALLGGLREWFPPWFTASLWDLSVVNYAYLGFACGLAFMLAELPNSFLKRQLDVLPGEVPNKYALRLFVLALDRFDSVIGVLLAVTILMPIAAAIWLWTLLLGPAVHAVFSFWLYRVGEKARAL
jgi:CDP-2,3-bis-(O-geranylgeranyl)-sn-glycerol synthase